MVAGLGNPGSKYAATRHNIGFRVVERFASSHKATPWQKWTLGHIARVELEGRVLVLLKPDTYMNHSGRAVNLAIAEFGCDIAGLIVVHDDLDIEFGALRIKQGGGHGGHNGIRSIIEEVETPDFLRIRLGVGRPNDGIETADYVLSGFADHESHRAQQLTALATKAIEELVLQGPQRAMNRFHTVDQQL